MDDPDEDMIYKAIQQHKLKILLMKFLEMKQMVENYIQELCFMADKIDKIHKNCTITNVVASSTGAVSGVLSILGLTLAPVTAGGSLALFATGMGLGVAASITGLSAKIVDRMSASQGRKYLNKVKKKSAITMTDLAKEANGIIVTIKKLKEIFQNTLPRSFGIPVLISVKWRLGTAGHRSTKVFQGALLSMSIGVRITGCILLGLSVLMDVAGIVQNSRHLLKGAESTTAAELREKAQNLAENLQELSEIYETLQKTLKAVGQGRGSLEGNKRNLNLDSDLWEIVLGEEEKTESPMSLFGLLGLKVE